METEAKACGIDSRPDQPKPGWFARQLLWYHRRFLCGFCYYVPLLVFLLLPWLLLTGLLGRGYGAQYLLYHDNSARGVTGGVALGVYWFAVLYVGYLLHLRDCREGPMPHPTGSWLGFLRYCGAIIFWTAVTAGAFYVVVHASQWAFEVFSTPPQRPAPANDPVLRPLLDATGVDPQAGMEAAPEIERPLRVYVWLWVGVGVSWLFLALVGAVAFDAAWNLGQGHGRLKGVWDRAGERLVGGAGRVGGWLEPVGKRLAKLQDLGVVAVVLLWFIIWSLAVAGCASHDPVVIARRSLFLAAGIGLTFAVIGLGGLYAARPFNLKPDESKGKADEGKREPDKGEERKPDTDRPVPDWLAVAALVVNLILGYAAGTWVLSRHELGIAAALGFALLWALLLAVSAWAFVPGLLPRLRAAMARLRRDTLPGEFELACLGLIGMVALMAAWTALVAWGWRWISPVPIVLFMLFGLVAGYGVFTYVIRRSLLIAVGLAVLVALVSHLNHYPMRFGDLEGEYHTPYPLADAVRDANLRQAAFDATLKALAMNARKQLDRQADLEQYLNEGDEAGAQAARAELDRLRKQEVELKRHRDAVWQSMERYNRVRAGRFASPAREIFDPESQPELRLASGLLETSRLKVWQGEKGPAGAGVADVTRKRPLVIVAVSGGGIRAAVWTFAVLKRIEEALAKRNIDFPSHVRLITGASGGMVGASYYTLTLPSPEDRARFVSTDPRAFDERLETLNWQQYERLASDFLTPLVRRAALTDLPNWLSPWHARHDRGMALERAWDRRLADPYTGKADSLNVPFSDLRDDEEAGRRPSLVFTPMMIEDGRRLIISNLDLRSATSNDGFVSSQDGGAVQVWGNHSVDAIELFRLFPQAPGQLRVKTAARMSASFPFFSPAVSLPTTPRRRVVDAGYYDNYGVNLAGAWLFSTAVRRWMNAQEFDSVLFIQIRDGVSEQDRQLRQLRPDGSNSGTRSVEEATSPLEGLLSMWNSSSMFRNDGLLEFLSLHYDPAPERVPETGRDDRTLQQRAAALQEAPNRLQVINFELQLPRGTAVSTSWYLSQVEKDLIRQSEKGIERNLKQMLMWWTEPLPRPQAKK